MEVGVLQGLADGLQQGLNSFAGASGRAAARANAVSKAAQNSAANFNQTSSNLANDINASTISNQYGFNSGQAALANQFTMQSWDKAASWNESMFQKQMDFNAEQAELNRQWQERMDSTKYQRAMSDMKAAGLNPILAAGGISASGGSGSAASVSSPSMSGASGAMASGGLLGANDASISGYNGQMEYMGGMLGLMSAAIGGISSAVQAMALMNNNDPNSSWQYSFKDFFNDLFDWDTGSLKEHANDPNTNINSKKREITQYFREKYGARDEDNNPKVPNYIKNRWKDYYRD